MLIIYDIWHSCIWICPIAVTATKRKGKDLTQPYDKSPSEKTKKKRDNTKQRDQKLRLHNDKVHFTVMNP